MEGEGEGEREGEEGGSPQKIVLDHIFPVVM